MNVIILEGLDRECPMNHREINDYKIGKAFNTLEPEVIRAFVLFGLKFYLMKNKNVAFILRDSSIYLNDINVIISEFNLKFEKNVYLVIEDDNKGSYGDF